MKASAAGRAPAVAAPDALELLARADVVLGAAPCGEEGLPELFDLLVPGAADWCGVSLGRRRFESAPRDAAVAALLRDGRAPDGRPLLRHFDRGSSLVVPVRARGRTLGSLTLLAIGHERRYTERDLPFAGALAGRIALAVDGARLAAEAGRSSVLLDTMFATAPVGLAFLDLERRFVRVNAALGAMTRRSVEEHVGRTLEEVLGPLAAPMAMAFEAVVRRGDPVNECDISVPAVWANGAPQHWEASFTPVRGTHGDLLGVGVMVVDVTERRRILEAERAARRRADFLARAGAALDASLDDAETLETVAELAVPAIADWCTIRLLDEDGRLHAVARAYADPGKRALTAEYEERFPPDMEAPFGPGAVARTGVAQLVPEVTGAVLAAAFRDPEQLELARRLGARAWIVAPLKARGRTFGTLSLVLGDGGRTFGEDDLLLAEELARRAGVAIDNARLYTARSRIAHALQAKLLPERLPEIPGVRLAARYRAAGELNEVGGDFYDVFPRAPGEWALVVGDVSGKGAEGAAVTALARYTLRAAALQPGAPSEALQTLNAAMLAETSLSQFVTVVLGYAAPDQAGGLRVRLALAGHPPPMVLRACGRVEEVERFGSVLGVVADPALPDAEVVLAPGDTMLLYTDGVIEAGPRSAPLGEEGLAALLAGHAGERPEKLLAAVELAAVMAQPGEPRDDIALLAVAVD